jgi:hypothetical protein
MPYFFNSDKNGCVTFVTNEYFVSHPEHEHFRC